MIMCIPVHTMVLLNSVHSFSRQDYEVNQVCHSLANLRKNDALQS